MSEVEAKTKKKMPKALKVCLIILAVIVGLALVLVIGVRMYFRLPVSDYYKNSEKAFVIPGLSDGMTHQGLCYDAQSNEFYITGYRSDGKASQVSVVGRDSGKEVKRLWLANTDGSVFDGHVGGITVNGKYVYVADEEGLVVYSRDDIANAQNGDTVRALGLFSTAAGGDSLKVAFVHATADTVYVGEFYREENYPTPDSHKHTTAAGDNNPALILAYKLDSSAEFGIGSQIEKAYSVPGLVQGMCVDENGRIYLSTSYAVAFSHIYIYDAPKQNGTIAVLGQSVPLFELDSSSMVKDIKAAPMAEEIVIVDGKLYTMCESATDKYIFGKFTSAKYCYATDISKYE